MGMKCCSCLAQKKKRTAETTHEGDTLCAKCYEEKLAYRRAEAENARKMREIEAKLEKLTGAKK